MQKPQLKDLLKDFNKNVIYDQDLKKKKLVQYWGKVQSFLQGRKFKGFS